MVICCGGRGSGDYRPGGLAGAAGLGVQGVMFAVLTLLAAWLWWKWFRGGCANKSTATVI